MPNPVPLLLLLCLVGLPRATALAQDARLAARLDPATAARVDSVVASARAAGFPTEPLIQKALEGASKGAAGPRIVVAVRGTFENLRRARDVLGAGTDADELVAAAASLRAGATPGMLRRLQQAGPRDGLAVPLAVLADLVADGIAVDAAWRSVEGLARGGARDAEFLRLRDRLEGGAAEGATDNAAAPPPRPAGVPAPAAPRTR